MLRKTCLHFFVVMISLLLHIFTVIYNVGGGLLKYAQIFIFCIGIILLSSCQNEEFPSINQHHSFVASVNILQPSITFYDKSGQLIDKWTFEKAYSGAELIDHDKLILYGHQLEEAAIYELSTGRKIKTIETGIGTTNGYYDREEKKLFLTNSKTNVLTSYNNDGDKLSEVRLRNYPLSMDSDDGKLYVINYKDTILSVVDMRTLQIIDEWSIEKSATGILLIPEEKSIWVGGHGEGSKPNQTIKVLDLHTGQLKNEIPVSLMPVNFSQSEQEVYVVNHGANELFVLEKSGEVLSRLEIAANPFAVSYFNESIIVAGFDDHTIYFVRNGKIEKTIQTDRGPFQLLVRERKT